MIWHFRQHAFTLLELLVVIAITSGLVLIALPSLGGARDSARSAVALGHLRQHGAVASIYQNDFDGMFPYITDPDATETIIRFPDGRSPRRLRYFYAWFGWAFALGPDYYDGYPSPTFTSPFNPSGTGASDYWYSCGLICRPEYWNTRTRLSGRSQWRPTRVHECLHPSAKAVFIEIHPAKNPGRDVIGPSWPMRMGFVDGSARQLAVGDSPTGYPTGDGDPTQSVHLGPPTPGLHTIDGVRGRDVR